MSLFGNIPPNPSKTLFSLKISIKEEEINNEKVHTYELCNESLMQKDKISAFVMES